MSSSETDSDNDSEIVTIPVVYTVGNGTSILKKRRRRKTDLVESRTSQERGTKNHNMTTYTSNVSGNKKESTSRVSVSGKTLRHNKEVNDIEESIVKMVNKSGKLVHKVRKKKRKSYVRKHISKATVDDDKQTNQKVSVLNEVAHNEVVDDKTSMHQTDDSENNVIFIPLRSNVCSSSSHKTYAMCRFVKTSIKGKSYTYRFYSDSNCLFVAKCKGRYPVRPIEISHGYDVHLSVGGQYQMIPDKMSKEFKLYEKNFADKLLMKTIILNELNICLSPTRISISIYDVDGLTNCNLVTRRPRLNYYGAYILDFKNRFTLPSEKNTIFTREDDLLTDVLSVRKIASDSLEITSESSFPPLAVFSSVLVLYTGKLSGN